MKTHIKIILLTVLGLGLVAFSLKQSPLYFNVPKGWPKPIYNFAQNPLTEEKFQLGRQLFYDPILSRDSTISCASCHLQATGFTHVDHAVSHGIDGRQGTRNAPVLMNLAWSSNFMWDGGVNHLDVQALTPISSFEEMDETLNHVVQKLQATKKYRALFKQAYGSDKITGQRVLMSVSQFVVMLTSSNAKYDKVQRGEAVFDAQEAKGYGLFKQNCASCHTEPLFTNNGFENNGIEPDPYFKDLGRMKITGNPADSLKFKVPTLRNIQFTHPYMHDGRFKTLTDVVKHYATGIHQSKTLSAGFAKPLNLTPEERVDLVAFLKTLSDMAFLYNPAFSYPR